MKDVVHSVYDDPYDRLFARNPLVLRKSKVNPEIKETFVEEPKEFVFSNNGITMLCEAYTHEPGTCEVLTENPRVVNGSQTLHSIRDVPNPSKIARAMIMIIEVPPPAMTDFSADAAKTQRHNS